MRQKVGKTKGHNYTMSQVSASFDNRSSKEKQKSPEERMKDGKALRKSFRRSDHARFSVPRDRIDPVTILEESDRGRIKNLVPIRHKRMMKSPFTFLRGLAALMAADLASTPSTGLRTQSCGDCHLQNFGGFATPERNVIFDINDFDETMSAPFEWDVKRLAVSAVLAGREMRLPNDIVLNAALSAAQSYRTSMRELARMDALDIWYSRITAQEFLDQIPKKSRRRFAEKRVEKAKSLNSKSLFTKLTEKVHGQWRIVDNPPLIFHPMRPERIEREIEGFFGEYYQSVGHELRVLLDSYRIHDIAVKVVGIGSVGTRCAIALLMGKNNDPLFLQFKEARRSVLEQFSGIKNSFSNQGQRVVIGQKLMQSATDIFLGWSSHMGRIDFYFRQLRDMKISVKLENFRADEFIIYLGLCGRSLAQAHARSGDPAIIAGYLGRSTVFEKSIANFAVSYANQTERDYSEFIKAISSGRLYASDNTSPNEMFPT
jgi:uncharacterized protein (DUF2252 family)